jgi:hypothetical protein
MVVLLLIRLIPVRRRFGARRKRLPVEVLYFPAAIDVIRRERVAREFLSFWRGSKTLEVILVPHRPLAIQRFVLAVAPSPWEHSQRPARVTVHPLSSIQCTNA